MIDINSNNYYLKIYTETANDFLQINYYKNNRESNSLNKAFIEIIPIKNQQFLNNTLSVNFYSTKICSIDHKNYKIIGSGSTNILIDFKQNLSIYNINRNKTKKCSGNLFINYFYLYTNFFIKFLKLHINFNCNDP